MTAILEMEELSKSFDEHQAVRGVSLSVEPGEVVALLGPNGAGKTTTIRMLMGLLEPTAGRARIGGHDCFAERSEVMRLVGYLPDTPVFYDYMRGRELIRFAGEMRGLPPEVWRERSDGLTRRLGLSEALEEFATNYSQGMKKKLALVLALLHQPRLLILDEPTSGLDPHVTLRVHRMIRELSEAGTAVFYSTHLLDQAERLCHRVGILDQGAIAALGSLDELQSRSPEGTLEALFLAVTGDDGEDP